MTQMTITNTGGDLAAPQDNPVAKWVEAIAEKLA